MEQRTGTAPRAAASETSQHGPSILPHSPTDDPSPHHHSRPSSPRSYSRRPSSNVYSPPAAVIHASPHRSSTDGHFPSALDTLSAAAESHRARLTTTASDSSARRTTEDLGVSAADERVVRVDSAKALKTRKRKEEEGDDDAKSKRQRSARACDACRRKKIRCDADLIPTCPDGSQDESTPCGNCARSSQLCTFSRVPLKRGPNKGFIQALEDRIRTLESSVKTDDLPTNSTSASAGTADSGPEAKTKSRGRPRASDSASPKPPSSSHGSTLVHRQPSPHNQQPHPFAYVSRVYSSSWQRAFAILPPRYQTLGFHHPALCAAAYLLVSPLDDPEQFWTVLSDTVGLASVGSPRLTRSPEVVEDEFHALMILYCAAARRGELANAILASAWTKILDMEEGTTRNRADWVLFQIDFWHSLSLNRTPCSRFLPLRRDLPTGRKLLGIPDEHPAAGLLLSSAMLAGLATRAADSAGWTEIREHEVALTFGLQWADDVAEGAAMRNTGPSAPREEVQARLALFAKLYHTMQKVPLLGSCNPSVVSSVVTDVVKMLVLADSPDKLMSSDVVAAHTLGLATIGLTWCACIAFALPGTQRPSTLSPNLPPV